MISLGRTDITTFRQPFTTHYGIAYGDEPRSDARRAK